MTTPGTAITRDIDGAMSTLDRIVHEIIFIYQPQPLNASRLVAKGGKLLERRSGLSKRFLTELSRGDLTNRKVRHSSDEAFERQTFRSW